MAEKQSCVYLVLKKSRLFTDEYPEFVMAFTDKDEAYEGALGWNRNDEWFTGQGLDHGPMEYYVRHVWL